MATSTLKIQAEFTASNGLQPILQSPLDLPTLTDTRPTQVTQGHLVLAAEGAAIALPIPANWTAVYQVVVVNSDTAGYVQLKTMGSTPALPSTAVNAQYALLAPNGGMHVESVVRGTQTGIQYSYPQGYTVQAVTSTGASTASVATQLYYYLVGA